MRERNTQVNIAFGRLLYASRKRLNLTITEAAAKCKISKSYYNEIEHGTRNITLENAVSIADIMGIDLTSFIKSQAQSHWQD